MWSARSWFISAILLLVNRYVGLGLTLLGPVLFNILTYHLLMNPSGIGMGAFATLLWALVALGASSCVCKTVCGAA